MTDFELTRLLAEKVMGWPVSRSMAEADQREAAGEGQIYDMGPGLEGPAFAHEEWEPLHRMDHAWQIVGRASEWGPIHRHRFTFELGCLSRENVSYDEMGVIWPCALFGVTPRAICLAALRAVGQDVEEG